MSRNRINMFEMKLRLKGIQQGRLLDRLNAIETSKRVLSKTLDELDKLDPNNPEELTKYINSKREQISKTDKVYENINRAFVHVGRQQERGHDMEIEYPKFLREIKSYLMDGENIYDLPHDIR